MTSARPSLHVVATEGVPPSARPLLDLLAAVVPVVAEPGGPDAAHLWFAPAPRPPGPRVVVWAPTPAAVPRDARAVLTLVGPPAIDRGGSPGGDTADPPDLDGVPADDPRDVGGDTVAGPDLLWVARSAAARGTRPLLAAQRRRLRALRGLPPRTLLRVAGPGRVLLSDARTGRAVEVAPDRLDTALAVCSAAVVDRAVVVRALAWGTPVVCEPATATRFALRDGAQVRVVRGAAASSAAALELAGDEAAAALLGRAGRLWVERTQDLPAQARTVLDRLGLPLTPLGPAARYKDVATALGAPDDSDVSRRLDALMAPLPLSRGVR